MNEAEFEAHSQATIQTIFPTLHGQIQQQRTFTLRFGHHAITIDGKQRFKAGGRCDILLQVQNIPRIMFELKRPGQVLDDDDRDQGISYARLLDPMPPFTVVSNGADVRIYQTFDRQELNVTTLGQADLQRALQFALQSAAAGREEAVRTLLDRQPESWVAVVRGETTRALSLQRGHPADVTRPLATGFSIRRGATAAVLNALRGNEPVVALTGPPLAGKTNVLARVCELGAASRFAFLYVDMRRCRQGVFRALSHQFSRGTSVPISVNDLRRWLARAAPGTATPRLVLVLDGWPDSSSGALIEDVDELLLMAEEGSVQIVFAVDDSVYDGVRSIPGRSTLTALGQAVRVAVGELSRGEFEMFARQLRAERRIHFMPGAEHAKPFRSPSLLRTYVGLIPPPPQNIPGGAFLLPSVVGVEMLQQSGRLLSTLVELEDDLQRFAEAVATDAADKTRDALVGLDVHRTGRVRLRTAERVLGAARLKRLRAQGYCTLSGGANRTALAGINAPETLAAAAAHFAANRLSEQLSRGRTAAAVRAVTRDIESLPYAEIVGARAIALTSRRGVDVSDVVSALMQSPPTFGALGPGARIAVQIPGRGHVELELEEATDGVLIGNPHPWLLLSYLAMLEHAEDQRLASLRRDIIEAVGSVGHVFRGSADFSPADMPPTFQHDIPGVGSVLCPDFGIIEPVTEAIRRLYSEAPADALVLITRAAAGQNIPLAWRLFHAFRFAEPTPHTAQIAAAMTALSRLIEQVVAIIAQQHG